MQLQALGLEYQDIVSLNSGLSFLPSISMFSYWVNWFEMNENETELEELVYILYSLADDLEDPGKGWDRKMDGKPKCQ